MKTFQAGNPKNNAANLAYPEIEEGKGSEGDQEGVDEDEENGKEEDEEEDEEEGGGGKSAQKTRVWVSQDPLLSTEKRSSRMVELEGWPFQGMFRSESLKHLVLPLGYKYDKARLMFIIIFMIIFHDSIPT